AATVQVSPAELAAAGSEPTTTESGTSSNRWAILRDGILSTSPSTGSTVVGRTGFAPVSRQPGKPDLPEATGSDAPGGSLFGTIVIIITRP
ncbi:MAG TPA: hypothetical protein VLD58_01045, partial [Gemmatimonadales bacterium]|nr:hypothetical protein [Gemmatimonadales bacterium]